MSTVTTCQVAEVPVTTFLHQHHLALTSQQVTTAMMEARSRLLKRAVPRGQTILLRMQAVPLPRPGAMAMELPACEGE